jgi:hypothetical protein
MAWLAIARQGWSLGAGCGYHTSPAYLPQARGQDIEGMSHLLSCACQDAGSAWLRRKALEQATHDQRTPEHSRRDGNTTKGRLNLASTDIVAQSPSCYPVPCMQCQGSPEH